jgi:hypothetical protein
MTTPTLPFKYQQNIAQSHFFPIIIWSHISIQNVKSSHEEPHLNMVKISHIPYDKGLVWSSQLSPVLLRYIFSSYLVL